MLNRVTITGADDQTHVSALVDLSARFPWVEWGILVSASQEGSNRFPSREWIGEFVSKMPSSANVSMHLCGRWVRELLIGKLDAYQLPADLVIRTGRIQINTHAEPHVSTAALYDQLTIFKTSVQWIFQLDGVNNHLLDAADYRRAFCGANLNVTGLYDLSHGAGVLPDAWPEAEYDYPGYAGGIGPDNVAEQIRKITPLCSDQFWIDMEGRVRTDEVLDIAKVTAVLEAAEPFIII